MAEPTGAEALNVVSAGLGASGPRAGGRVELPKPLLARQVFPAQVGPEWQARSFETALRRGRS